MLPEFMNLFYPLESFPFIFFEHFKYEALMSLNCLLICVSYVKICKICTLVVVTVYI